jgi:cell division septation protein DedD
MNKLFAALLFFCVIGASVLWWLMKMLPDDHATTAPQVQQSIETVEGVQGSTSEKPVDGLVLRVDTIPQGASVEVGDAFAGVTPLDILLQSESKDATIRLEGYDTFKREIPSIEDAEGAELNWKITLKAKPAETSKETDEIKAKPIKNAWFRGSAGPYFIQLKAVEDSIGKAAMESEISTYRQMLSFEKVSGCFVNLGKRGKWYRVLVGPFENRADAAKKRNELMNKIPEMTESFITGRQSCI